MQHGALPLGTHHPPWTVDAARGPRRCALLGVLRSKTERPWASTITERRRSYIARQSAVYPFHDWTATVTHCGRICFKKRKVNLSQVFAGQDVGVKQVSDRIWLVSFMDYDLGYFDDETCRLEPIENPFGPKVLPMCPE
jgi:hypothetical protein